MSESVVCVFANFFLGVFAVGPLQFEGEWVVAAEREPNMYVMLFYWYNPSNKQEWQW